MALKMPSWVADTVGMKRSDGSAGSARKQQRTSPGPTRPRPSTRRARATLEPGDSKYSTKDIPTPLKALLTTCCKANANVLQRTRTLEGNAYECYLTPSDCKMAEAMTNAISNYHEQAKAKGANHGLGPPDVHSFLALINALHQDGDVGSKNKEFLANLMAGFSDKTPLEIAAYVKTCTVSESREIEKNKIVIGLADPTTRQGITKCFCAMSNVQHKPGRPPPSGLEDDLEKWIQALSIGN